MQPAMTMSRESGMRNEYHVWSILIKNQHLWGVSEKIPKLVLTRTVCSAFHLACEGLKWKLRLFIILDFIADRIISWLLCQYSKGWLLKLFDVSVLNFLNKRLCLVRIVGSYLYCSWMVGNFDMIHLEKILLFRDPLRRKRKTWCKV